ncbi:MAG: uroporphyrinogen decarboxylase family protein [Leptolinea sp.]
MNNQLSGKELLLGVLRHENMPAIPWVPFAGVHAGKLKGYTAQEVLTDANKLLESLLEVNRIYDPDGQPVIFDLQIEAEILGCELMWVTNSPPSVATHPLSATLELPAHLPEAGEGRLPLILKVMREMKKEVGDHTALYGLICGPLTLASHLRGTEVFMDMFKEQEYLKSLIDYCRAVCFRMIDLYVEAGMDVIAVVDPLVSQVSPKHFNQYLAGAYTDIFKYTAERGVISSFFVCGDATKSLDVMCQTNPDSISVDENVNLVAAKEITDRYNITICGNIPLTTHMLLGTQQDNMKYVVDTLDQLGSHNRVLSPGCDMPYDVPIENIVGILQALRDPESARKMLVNYHSSGFDDIVVDLPNYKNLKRPLVEVFTLDSDTCAACGYMVSAAKRAVAECKGEVDLVEYKFTLRENVARVMKMGIKNLPSLVINGELKYSSIIPNMNELVAEIEKAMK